MVEEQTAASRKLRIVLGNVKAIAVTGATVRHLNKIQLARDWVVNLYSLDLAVLRDFFCSRGGSE